MEKGFEIRGASASGVGTCMVVPKLKLVLDIGFCSPEARKFQTVLVTHAHVDHMAGAVQHAAARSLAGNKPSRFVCSPEVAEMLEDLLSLWKKAQGDFEYEVVPLSPKDEGLRLHNNLVVKAVPTFHRVPSQGYLVFETRKKLKAEFQGMPGHKIGQLRKEGVVVQDVVEVPVLAFMGDTLPEALAHPDVLRAHCLVTECTFVNESAPVAFARERGHTHLDELADMLSRFEVRFDQLVLVHFSLRHSREEIEEALAAKMPFHVRGVTHLLLDGDGPVQGW